MTTQEKIREVIKEIYREGYRECKSTFGKADDFEPTYQNLDQALTALTKIIEELEKQRGGE